MKKIYRQFLFLALLSLSPKVYCGKEIIYQSSGYSVALFTGIDIRELIPFMAKTQINEFRNYPYLYVGSLGETIEYLNWFSNLKNSAVILACHDKEPVGFLTVTDFTAYAELLEGSIEIFKDKNLNSELYCYISEAIILASHRGKKLGSLFIKAVEQYARKLDYQNICTVIELHDNHPMKPENYVGVMPIATHFGYLKSSITVPFSWKTLKLDQSIELQSHTLTFWFKSLII